MEEKFNNWLMNAEGKVKGTADGYCSAIRHLSDHYSGYEHQLIDLFEIQDPAQLEQITALYDKFGKYADVGAEGHNRYISALKALVRFLRNEPSMRGNRVKTTRQPNNRSQNPATNFDFSPVFKAEASEMCKHYEVFYCLERSIRSMIVEAMESRFGADWWLKRVSPEIRENVSKNIKWEADTGYTRRSSSKIDYTTFGELRQIVKFNWDAFSDKFTSLNAFNSIMITLNTLRVPIAHCTPLADDEVVRLNLTVKDWFRLTEPHLSAEQ